MIDEEGTRMADSLQVWEDLLKNEDFQNATIVLLFNKSDLFEDKIKSVNMSETFSDYSGGHDMKEGVKYIAQMFISKAEGTTHNPDNLHTHTTCAIDTGVMKKVFDDVSEEIFKARLALNGLNPIF